MKARWYDRAMLVAKKQSRTWYIAATFYLTTGMFMLLCAIFLAALNYLLLDLSGQVLEMAAYVAWPVLLYIGARYAASYVNKTYAISDAGAVVRYALMYNLVFSVLVWGYALYMMHTLDAPFTFQTALGILSTVINVTVVYLTSRYYIRASL